MPALATPVATGWPTQEAIERAKQANPFPNSKRLNQVPVPGIPAISPAGPGLDIEALANRHVELYRQHQDVIRETATLRVFVTLAMPAPSLRLLADQAERSGAILVLRGLKDNSMKQTLAAVQTLIGERKIAWQIDPETFARFSVRQAPTFVLSRPVDTTDTRPTTCVGSCSANAGFVSIAGDVSLDYALDTMVRRYPDAASPAAPFIKRLRVAP